MNSVNKPVRVQAGRAQAGSSVTAGSCWCSPVSEAPGRRAGSPGPGWLGWHSCGLHAARGLLLRCGSPCCLGFFDGHLESRLLLHCLLCLSYLHHDLEEKQVPCHSSDKCLTAALREQRAGPLRTPHLAWLTHLMWVHWPVPCNQVEGWGASRGWRGWGGSWTSWDCGLCQSYQSGHGSGNTYWMYVLLWKEAQVHFTFI